MLEIIIAMTYFALGLPLNFRRFRTFSASRITNVALLATVGQAYRQVLLGRRHLGWCRQPSWPSRLNPPHRKIIERRYRTFQHGFTYTLECQRGRSFERSLAWWKWHAANHGQLRGLAGQCVDQDGTVEQCMRRESSTGGKVESTSADLASRPSHSGARRRSTIVNDLKRQLDENPYRVLFGYRSELRERSGTWSPHGMWKSLRSRLEISSDDPQVSGESGLEDQTRPPRQNRPGNGKQPFSTAGPGSTKPVFESRSAAESDYYIDPVTLRKVYKSSDKREGAVDIPVKRSGSYSVNGNFSKDASKAVPRLSSTDSESSQIYKVSWPKPTGTSSTDPTSNPGLPTPSRQDGSIVPSFEGYGGLRNKRQGKPSRGNCAGWLFKEGFTPEVSQTREDQFEPDAPAPQMQEPSLNAATLPNVGRPASNGASARRAADNEDLDKLRAADVRASAGIVKTLAKPSRTPIAESSITARSRAEEHTSYQGEGADASRRKAKHLIDEVREIYENSYGVIDPSHRQPEMPVQQAGRSATSGARSPSTLRTTPKNKTLGTTNEASTAATADDSVDSHLARYEEKLGPTPYEFDLEKDTPIKALKVQFGNTDPKDDKTGAAQGSGPVFAPRAAEEERVLRDDIKEVEAFLREVDSQLDVLVAERRMRSVATVKAAGPVEPTPSSVAEAASSSIYKIVALDPLTQQISSAVATSSTAPQASEKIGSLAEIMLRLHSPSRFLAYLEALQADGFEVVTGGGDVLVFKKVREPISKEKNMATYTDCSGDHGRRPITPPVNPIDGTTMGTFTSPTGFVNYNVFQSPMTEDERRVFPAQESSSPLARDDRTGPDRDRVNREEPVFSGRQKWQEQEANEADESSRKGRAGLVKGMVWVGTWVAVCSYAVGVVSEYFKNGGRPRGF